MQVLRNGGRGMAGLPQDLVRGADGMIGSKAVQEDNWPFWWLKPHSNTQYRQPQKTIFAPAPATLTEVVSLTVPAGFVFILRAIRQTFQTGIDGAAVFVDGSGDILWTVDVDRPIGTTGFSGYALPDMFEMAEQRGSQENPWPIEGYTVFDEYQTIRYKVETTNAIAQGGAGSPNFITCGLFGWLEKALR